jgi:hypothetical protein
VRTSVRWRYARVMRAPLVALVAAVLVVVGLVQSSRAEPPPAMEPRKVTDILAALKKTKAPPDILSSVRWYADVAHGETLQVPVGSSPQTLGAWSDNGALLASERASGTCEPLGAAESKAAQALATEFGTGLPASLRGVALADAGKATEAVKVFTELGRSMFPDEAGCPGEHPMYSHRRVERLSRVRACVQRWAPKADHASVEKLLERAKSCAANNHAVG